VLTPHETECLAAAIVRHLDGELKRVLEEMIHQAAQEIETTLGIEADRIAKQICHQLRQQVLTPTKNQE
jgi:hypothetical protein